MPVRAVGCREFYGKFKSNAKKNRDRFSRSIKLSHTHRSSSFKQAGSTASGTTQRETAGSNMFTIPTNEPVPADAYINEKQNAIAWDITLFAKP